VTGWGWGGVALENAVIGLEGRACGRV